jgi:hypothetical protein
MVNDGGCCCIAQREYNCRIDIASLTEFLQTSASDLTCDICPETGVTRPENWRHPANFDGFRKLEAAAVHKTGATGLENMNNNAQKTSALVQSRFRLVKNRPSRTFKGSEEDCRGGISIGSW